MEEYKSNSYKSKENISEKKVEKIVTGEVRTKRKSEAGKIKELFISDDASNVKSYVIMDVLIPAIKKAISDIVTNGIEMILYGETGKSSRRSNAERVSYRSYYDDRHDVPRTIRSSSRYEVDDVIFENRGEAERVLESMDELIGKYGIVSVADMLDLSGITPNYTDNRYGWTSLYSAAVTRIRDGGYTIKLPRAMPID